MTTNVSKPAPDAAFRWTRESWGDALRCVPLEPLAQHLFTTKQLQLRPFEQRSQEWGQALAAIGGNHDRLLRVKQVHGATVRVVSRDANLDDEARCVPEADAVVSNVPGAALGVQVADCVPLLISSMRGNAVAAVHAGWRGTRAGIAAAAVRALGEHFDVAPGELVAAIGPSIGPCCYEVGGEVVEQMSEAGLAAPDVVARWFIYDGASTRLDLWAANRDQLIGAGVPPDQIHVCRLCTRTHAEIFDSYRAEGPNAGRMAALIALRGAPRVPGAQPSSAQRSGGHRP
jgi:polyphenol oxidase